MKWTACLVSSLAACVALGISAAAANDEKIQFEHVLNIGSAGTGEGQFKYVEDFAFTKDGYLLATDAVHAWVQVFDKTSGKFISRFGGKGEGEANLDKPEGIAVDPNGNAVFRTCGCVHADAVALLIAAGLFDLPQPAHTEIPDAPPAGARDAQKGDPES